MRAVDIIIKKRDRGELSRKEIEFFIQGFTKGEIPDYQAAAWAMAILLNGMTPRETTDLTLALAHSGEMMDCTVAVPVAVDKHSTGGVGDKTTLVVQPLVAACGLPVGKISGRGLGFSGGTLDKLESIPGCRVDLNTDEFLDQLGSVGVVLTGQTADLAPADGKSVCPAGCHRHRAIHSLDRFICDEQEDRWRGNCDFAGCESWVRSIHGDYPGSQAAGRADGGYRQGIGSQRNCLVIRYESTAGPGCRKRS